MTAGASRTAMTVIGRFKRCVMLLAAIALLASGRPSDKLIDILSLVSHFDDGSLVAISYWASYPNPQAPDMVLTDLDRVQTEAVQLAPDERGALFAWLNHGGRQKLLALGVSDTQIGPCQKLIDQKSCQTATAASTVSGSGGARNLALRLMPADPESGVELDGGFAMLNAPATLVDCIAFHNNSNKTTAAITFTYRMVDAAGKLLVAGSNILVGSFAPGARVAAPEPAMLNSASPGDVSQKPANCWSKILDGSTALPPAVTVVVDVASVTFEDGTHWSR